MCLEVCIVHHSAVTFTALRRALRDRCDAAAVPNTLRVQGVGFGVGFCVFLYLDALLACT